MPFVGQTFDRETLDLSDRVFDQAWGKAQRSASMPAQVSDMRDKLASHIIDVASEGERAPQLLKFTALRAFFAGP